MEERLENIENMLSQLIKMVGNLNIEQQEMKKEQQEMKKEQQEMKKEQQEMKKEFQNAGIKSEERHHEVVDRLKSLEIDQDFIWEKTVRNEREIENLKRRLNS
jgi:formiminotetrahydrofolate cyclodeaminase